MHPNTRFAVALVATAIATIVVLAATGFRCTDADDRNLTPCIPQGVSGTLNPKP